MRDLPAEIKALRREILAHCITFAKDDEIYARWAAKNYQQNPIFGCLFEGLVPCFEVDLSRAKIEWREEGKNANH